MRSLFTCFLITLLTFGLVVNEASAKRFGGGRSIGMQRSQSSLFSQNKSFNNSSVSKQMPNKSRWGGLLGGMLIGGLLASLFMGNGFAQGIMTWLLLGMAAFFIIGLFRKKFQPSLQGNTSNLFNQARANSPFMNTNPMGSNGRASMTLNVDSDAFLRQAKVSFIRLQSAYDQKNLHDIQSFTLPEVFAEIKMQLDELDNATNKTDVVTLNAELLDVSQQAGSTVASVRFTGSIKENHEPLSALNEIWHFRKFDNSTEWMVGGIQQEVYQP